MNSFTDGSAFCPGAPKRVPSDSEKHRRVYTSSNVCHSHEWRGDTASGKTLKKQNACLHAIRQAVEKKIACTASEAKGLKVEVKQNVHTFTAVFNMVNARFLANWMESNLYEQLKLQRGDFSLQSIVFDITFAGFTGVIMSYSLNIVTCLIVCVCS